MTSPKIRGLFAGVAAALTLALAATSAQAIRYGDPDAGEHPYVGLAVFYDAGGAPMWRCSGALVSPTLFLTAGHCTFGASMAGIWFEEDVQSGIPGNGYPFGGATTEFGTPHSHPNYNDNAFYLYDLGVIVMDQPVVMSEYASLPALGALDPWLNKRGIQDTTMTAVGYGLQWINPVFVEGERVRLKATMELINLRTIGMDPGTSVGLTNNAATGGTCFGDSGGPIFINNTTTIGAVTSFGINGNCAGTGWGYRVDQSDDLDWLYGDFGAHLQ